MHDNDLVTDLGVKLYTWYPTGGLGPVPALMSLYWSPDGVVTFSIWSSLAIHSASHSTLFSVALASKDAAKLGATLHRHTKWRQGTPGLALHVYPTNTDSKHSIATVGRPSCQPSSDH